MLKIEQVSKSYRKRNAAVTAAEDISLTLQSGDFAVIHGPSGSGKSTLLLMAGGMLEPDAGKVFFDENDVYHWPSRQRNRYRKQAVGFIFQRFHLLPYLTVRENIRMPLALQGAAREKGLIEAVAERLGLAHRLQHRATELSVGEQQRVAVARALVGDKRLILADEPTGNLDEENVRSVAQVLRQESENGRIVVLVTHNPALRDLGNRRLHLKDGKLTPGPRL